MRPQASAAGELAPASDFIAQVGLLIVESRKPAVIDSRAACKSTVDFPVGGDAAKNTSDQLQNTSSSVGQPQFASVLPNLDGKVNIITIFT